MKSLVLLVALLVISATCYAKQVTLSWDASPSAGVTGYTIHYSTDNTQPFPESINVGDVLTYIIDDLSDELGYYFGVSAYNAAGMESAYSNIVLSPGFVIPESPASLNGTTLINNVIIPFD